MTRLRRRRSTAALLVCLVAVTTGLTGALGPSADATSLPEPASRAGELRIGVSAPQYDSPGAVVPAVVTAYEVPSGYAATITARSTRGSRVECVGAVWHNRERRTASRKCYLWLPTSRGSDNLIGRAVLRRAGSPTLRVAGRGARPVRASGVVSRPPITLEQIAAVESCSNPTDAVWLTFDDGGTDVQVGRILDTLAATGVRGRFLFTGTWRDDHRRMLARITREGHLLGNHTATHPALSELADAGVRAQVRGGIASTTSPRILRPPFGAGAFSTRLLRLAEREGYVVCRWTSDTYDWDGATAALMVERIRHGDYRTPPLAAGGNLLMHGTAPFTSTGLRTVIQAIRAEGLTLDPLPPR